MRASLWPSQPVNGNERGSMVRGDWGEKERCLKS